MCVKKPFGALCISLNECEFYIVAQCLAMEPVVAFAVDKEDTNQYEPTNTYQLVI